MKNYIVYMPITLSVAIQVEAETAKEAIRKAWDEPWSLSIEKVLPHNPNVHLHRMECHDIVAHGNVFSGVQNEIYAEEGIY
jgi:hypothetical protein